MCCHCRVENNVLWFLNHPHCEAKGKAFTVLKSVMVPQALLPCLRLLSCLSHWILKYHILKDLTVYTNIYTHVDTMFAQMFKLMFTHFFTHDYTHAYTCLHSSLHTCLHS